MECFRDFFCNDNSFLCFLALSAFCEADKKRPSKQSNSLSFVAEALPLRVGMFQNNLVRLEAAYLCQTSFLPCRQRCFFLYSVGVAKLSSVRSSKRGKSIRSVPCSAFAFVFVVFIVSRARLGPPFSNLLAFLGNSLRTPHIATPIIKQVLFIAHFVSYI